jgi:hypothetical protein
MNDQRQEVVSEKPLNNQLDALFQYIYLFTSLHVSSSTVLIIEEIELYQYTIWYVLIQFDLLMMSTVLLETCREANK